MFDVKTALVLAPHTDDCELGCGGTLAKLVNNGVRVISIAFSAAEQSVPPQFPRDILRNEVKMASGKLGIAEMDCVVLHYEVRRFSESRQSILDDMLRLSKDYCPDVVFLPSAHDTHQDHAVIAQEGFRAFKRKTMLGYEVPWNNLDFRTSTFVNLEESHVETKIRALNCYKSQAHRNYASEEFVRSLAVVRGTQIGVRFAEAFEVVRWVIC